MKFLSAVTMAVLLAGMHGNANASMEFNAKVHSTFGLPLVQKVTNHLYKSQQFDDGTDMRSVYWTGTKVFQKGDICLVVKQKFNRFEKTESKDKLSFEQEPVVEQSSSIKDCSVVAKI